MDQKYFINLVTFRTPESGVVKSTRIQSPVVPEDELFEAWKEDTVLKFLSKVKIQPMYIELTETEFINLVVKLYQKIGKKVKLYLDEDPEEGQAKITKSDLLFRIPTKIGAFFEQIESIKLYSDTYKSNICIIRVQK